MPRATRTAFSDFVAGLRTNPQYRILEDLPASGVPLAERIRLAEEGRFLLHRDEREGFNPKPWDKDYMAHPAVFRAASSYALSHRPTIQTVRDIFSSKNCPVSMLITYKSLTAGMFDYIRGLAAQSVACNSRTPGRTLRGFLKGDSITRGALAHSPYATPDMLWALAKDSEPYVRGELAEQCRDAEILDYLSKDALTKIRVRVARNIHSPRRTLSRLLKDPKASVRAYAIANERTPLNDVRRVARVETSPAAIANALSRLGESEQEVSARAATHESAHARKAAAATTLNPVILDTLAWDANRDVRQIAARNSKASPAAQVAVYLQSVAE